MDEQVLADARTVLGDARRWRLGAARWAAIAPVVEELAAAVRDGRTDAAHAAVVDLELLSPVRAGRPATAAEPAPEPVRERIDGLLAALHRDR